MKQLKIYSIATNISLIVCGSFLLVSCGERKPAGSDRPKTKEKTVEGADLKMFNNEKKTEKAPEVTPSDTSPSEMSEKNE